MTKVTKNYGYFHRHFHRLAKRYGGKVIVIAGGRVVGTCRKTDSRKMARLVASAQLTHPSDIPFVAPVPTTKELATPLLI